MTECEHPPADVKMYHRDAHRVGAMKTIRVPAYCQKCESQLDLEYTLENTHD